MVTLIVMSAPGYAEEPPPVDCPHGGSGACQITGPRLPRERNDSIPGHSWTSHPEEWKMTNEHDGTIEILGRPWGVVLVQAGIR